MRWLLATLLLLLTVPALAADLAFTGNLRFVATNTITVRLPDGWVVDAHLPKSGELSSANISVRMVAIDEDWSAVRFRNTAFIKTLGRPKETLLSGRAKQKSAKQESR